MSNHRNNEQYFLEKLNDLSQETGLHLFVNAVTNEINLTENEDGVYNLGFNKREDGSIIFDWY